MKYQNRDNILISVIMLCHNSEKYISEAIESILNQTFESFELIIVYDPCTDRSLEIIEKYKNMDNRIILFKSNSNIDIVDARNIGIKMAKGKYIAFQDSDDISLHNRFEEQINYLEKHHDCGAVGSYIDIFDSDTKKTIGIRKYSENDKDLRDNIFFYCPIAQPSSMIRKDVFTNIGLYDIQYPLAEDLDLWFRLGTNYKFGNIQKILLKYRYYDNSTTARKIRVIEKISNKIRWKNWNNNAYHFGFMEFSFNLLHLISIYIIPSKLKLRLFNKLRDDVE